MKTKILMTTAAAVLMLGAIPAQANHHEKSFDEKFAMKDTDGNGMISQEEFMNKYSEKFNEMDSDNDDSISKSEAKAYMESEKEEKMEKKFEKVDSDGNGTISQEEFMEYKKDKWDDKR